uniref:AsmA family protein n=1 Tax=Rhodopseudomonas palustris (strain BisA53) TaxID=316055 RepID=Q07PP9_RHOP5
MQATLLGIATAAILALIAALVGPYFIDWNQFRPRFEAEAARAIGAPVRVAGELDARLLPTPTLRLRQVVVGGANDPGRVRADRLDVEFSLGSLMRGEVHASELTIGGFALDLGLDAQGKLDWPAATAFTSLGALAIDRLNLTGRIALHDARRRSTLELNDIAFSGEVKALAGAIRGDGNFLVDGTRYPFRLWSNRAGDNAGSRLRFALESSERGWMADLEGLFSVEARTPRFDGALTLASVAARTPAEPTPSTPWRLTGKLKADPAGARFDQVEASFGAEASALRFAGQAEARFGAAPELSASLSARQLDLDRLLKQQGGDADLRWLPELRRMLGAVPAAPMPTRLDLSVEQIMLGGRAVQNLSAELRSQPQGWAIERLALRAPGGSELSIDEAAVQSGELQAALKLASADPDLLLAWIAGRSEPTARVQKPLSASGRLALGADRVAIEQLRAEIDGHAIEGSASWAGTGTGSRAEAKLKAERLDLDAAIDGLRALAGPRADWPAEGQLSLDIAEATWSGQTLRPLQLQLGYGPDRITLARLRGGEPGQMLVEASGALDRRSSTGQFDFSARASSLRRIAEWMAPSAPAVATRLNAVGAGEGTAQLGGKLVLSDREAPSGQRVALATLTLDAPLKGRVALTGWPTLAAIHDLDGDALMQTEAKVDASFASEPGTPLLALLGLDRVLAPGSGPIWFESSATGAWQKPWRLTAHLRGDAVDAELAGTVEPWSSEPKAASNLNVRRANLAPLAGRDPGAAPVPNLKMTSRLGLAGNKLRFDDIDATMAGSRMRGRLALTRGQETELEGEFGLDSLELAPALQLALGVGADATAPLGPGVLQNWRGRLAFQALRGGLPGGIELRPISGMIRSDGASLSLDKLAARIGGGEAKGDLTARRSADGLTLDARLQWSGVDGAALRYRGLAMPEGKTALQMTLAGAGRSAAAVVANLSGGGLVSIEQGRIAGLDPKAFEAAIHAAEGGQPIDDVKLGRIVEPVLAQGALKLAKAQIPFSIDQGRLRVSPTPLDGEGARIVVSGGYDIAADQADLRAVMSVAGPASGLFRPELQVWATGTPDALQRQIDVAALASWLATRRIDSEIQRLQTIEQSETPTLVPPQPLGPPTEVSDPPVASIPSPTRDPREGPKALPRSTTTQAAPLPPPITVRPAPGDARRRLPPPMVLTPPTTPRAAF